MEPKRLILAFAIIVAFMMLWSWLFPPPKRTEAPPADVPGREDVISDPAHVPEAPIVADPAAGEAPPRLAALDGGDQEGHIAALPKEAVAGEYEEEIAIDTPLMAIRLSSRGARITSWRLKEYEDDAGEPLDLVSPAAAKLDYLPLDFLLPDENDTEALREALFRVERREDDEDGESVITVTLTYSDGEGLAAVKILRVPHASYISSLEGTTTVGGRPITPTIVWGAGFGRHGGESSGGMGFGRLGDNAQGIVKLGDRIERRAEGKITPESPWMEAGTISWAGLEDKYFAALLIPESPAAGQMRVDSLRLVEGGKERSYLSFSLQQPGQTHYRLFVGPKDYDLLQGLGFGLDQLVDFGFFSVIALPLFYALKFVEGYTGNYGWAIIILTIVLRMLFFPFMHRGQLKMRKMQDKMKRVQPKVKALRERYRRLERKEVEKGRPGARQELRGKMNQEMMALYKKEDINPLGSMSGCLPLLVQMPILYGFYTILTISIELRKAPFMLWIGDLSQKDPYYVTPLVMGATMLLQQMMTSSSMPDPTQRRMMYMMPIMFTYFFINLPSGLVLYWLVNNLLGIVQQYLVNKQAAAASTEG
jgi:YidC/Oxa1 family membrane protein insertase